MDTKELIKLLKDTAINDVAKKSAEELKRNSIYYMAAEELERLLEIIRKLNEGEGGNSGEWKSKGY